MATRILFITGTDTGVGKTLLTALLLQHLRANGVRALALKPFCSGSRLDAKLLHSLQESELTPDQINPFYFPEPVAPLVAARAHHRRIKLGQVLKVIRAVAAPGSKLRNQESKAPSCLLIEGSGGLLVPLGESFSVLDLISTLRCEVIVAARNRLGTLNHTLLTVRALRSAGLRRLKVVLMNARIPDASAASNAAILRECLGGLPLMELPFLGTRACTPEAVRANALQLRSKMRWLLSNGS